MVEIKNLKKCYGDRTVLDIPELVFENGTVTALAGANGSGKTTLLRILAGIIKKTEGNVKTPASVLYLPQQCYAFCGNLIKNITLSGADEKEASVLLQKLGLDNLASKKAKSLSGGELQRLALCRILSKKCELLLLDEPTSACDARGAQLVTEAINDYKEKYGCTVIMSTHSPALAVNSAQRLIVLGSGRIEADGAPSDILSSPESQWAKSFTSGWKI